MAATVRRLHEDRRVEGMSRFTSTERVDEIEKQLPDKRPGQTRYCNRQYRNLEEMVKICRKQQQQLEELKAELRALKKAQRSLTL